MQHYKPYSTLLSIIYQAAGKRPLARVEIPSLEISPGLFWPCSYKGQYPVVVLKTSAERMGVRWSLMMAAPESKFIAMWRWLDCWRFTRFRPGARPAASTKYARLPDCCVAAAWSSSATEAPLKLRPKLCARPMKPCKRRLHTAMPN